MTCFAISIQEPLRPSYCASLCVVPLALLSLTPDQSVGTAALWKPGFSRNQVLGGQAVGAEGSLGIQQAAYL